MPDEILSEDGGTIERVNGLRWYLTSTGQRYPSVTSILGWVFKYERWARFTPGEEDVEYARWVGTEVHAACALISDGHTIAPGSRPPEVMPYVHQFNLFQTETQFCATGAEMRLMSERYKYGGRGDLVGSFPPHDEEEGILIDIKTTEDTWLARYQTAAYLNAWREMTGKTNPMKRATLLLSRSSWKLRETNKPEDMNTFLSALNVFRAAEQEGRL